MAEIGDILLFYLIGYILIKKNNLLKIKLKIMKQDYTAFGIFPLFIYAKYKRDLTLENLILRMIIIIFYGVLITTSLKFIIMRSCTFKNLSIFSLDK